MKVALLSVLFSVLFLELSIARAAAPGVVIDVALSPAGDFKSKTDEVKGEAIADGDGVKAENIVVSLKNLKSGISLRDKHAREKYLETEKFPDAILTKASGKGGKGTGLLKIRGIEKEVSGTYAVAGDTLTAEFPVKLSEYGITGIKYMGIGVNDEVKLHVTVPYKRH